MRESIERRAFLARSARTIAGAAGAAAAVTLSPLPLPAIDPIPRAPAKRLKVGCAAYSLRQYLDLKSPRMTLEEFIEKSARWGTDGVELTEYYFRKPVTPEYLIGLKRQAVLWGQGITGSPVGNSLTVPPGKDRDRQVAQARSWIDVCAELGAPTMRIFAGGAPKGVAEDEARRWVVECIEACSENAARRGVFLVLENHGGVTATAEGTLAILRAVRSPWVGANLDTGNFEGPDPYAELALVAPYALTCHVKTEITVAGKRQPADSARLVEILTKANYRGYMTLEYEGAEDPMTAVPAFLEKMAKAIG